MSAQSTKRPGLVPKMITDVNGVPKKVWVRPEELGGQKGDPTLGNIQPLLNERLNEGLSHMRKGEKQGSLKHTSEEKRLSSERGYGTDGLRKAAAFKFERDFGIPLHNAPPVEISNDELYDYLSRGVSIEQAHEFARYGIDPDLAHPKLDAEYAFVSEPKVAKLDLRNQEASDSPMRKAELDNIKRTAHALQSMDIDPYVAAQCIGNGLRMEHLNSKSHDIKETIEASVQNNVESDRFKNRRMKDTRKSGFGGKLEAWGDRTRRRAVQGAKRYARQTTRRIVRRVNRKAIRFLKLVFLPWKTR